MNVICILRVNIGTVNKFLKIRIIFALIFAGKELFVRLKVSQLKRNVIILEWPVNTAYTANVRFSESALCVSRCVDYI